jgi:predicted ATPase
MDISRQTQYIGYSRNILLSINGHIAQNGAENCAFLRVQTFKFPKREEMESVRDAWIASIGSIPPGNGGESERWAATVGQAARSAMSAEEQKAYEEKKLKLRKAMADSTLTKELETAAKSDGERAKDLEAAVNNDDWSAVIQSQTQETKSGS